MWCGRDPAEVLLVAGANFSSSIGPNSTSSRVGSPITASAHRRVEPVQELVVDRLVHDRRAERGAALPRRAEAGEQRALDGQVEVGVVGDDHRVLAAELQARRLQVPSAQLADPRADLAGPGEPDLVDRALAPAPGSRPSNVVRAVGVAPVLSTPSGQPRAPRTSSVEAPGPTRRSTRPASTRPRCRTAAPGRGTRTAPRPGSCRP